MKRNNARHIGHIAVERVRRQIWRVVLWVAVLAFFIALLQVAFPLYMMQVYDRVLGTQNIDTLLVLTGMVIAALVVWGTLDYLESQILSALGHSNAMELSFDALEAAVEAGGRGPVRASQALRDISEIRSFFGSSAVAVPFDAALSPVLIIVLYFMHPAYLAVALVGVVFMVGFSVLVRMTTAHDSRRASEEGVLLSADVEAASRSAEAINAMGMMPALMQRWHRSQSQQLRLVHRATSRAKALTAAARVTRVMLQVALYGTGAVLIIDKAASPGSMFAASIIMGRMLQPFERLVESWKSFMSAREAFGRVSDLLENAPRRRVARLARPDGRLSFEKVTYVPEGMPRPTLRSVTFEVAPGQVFGIVGASAAGKTTLARAAVGALQPTGGGVFLDGQNVWHWDPADLGQHVGYLPQTVCLLQGTVAENIARFGYDDRDRIVEAARRAGAHEFIGRLPHGYDTSIGEAGAFLSGGQRQMIALARALYGEPRLLVLDEPNAHVDRIGEGAIISAVETARLWGAAVIIVAHKISVLASVDYVVVMQDGTVNKIGRRADVFAPAAADPSVVVERGPLAVTPIRASGSNR